MSRYFWAQTRCHWALGSPRLGRGPLGPGVEFHGFWEGGQSTSLGGNGDGRGGGRGQGGHVWRVRIYQIHQFHSCMVRIGVEEMMDDMAFIDGVGSLKRRNIACDGPKRCEVAGGL